MDQKVEVEQAAEVERIIIDTDPGIDDCMALFLAMACPEKIKLVR